MKLIDLHCDTLWQLTDFHPEEHLYENTLQVSVDKMRQAGTLAQFFACFVYMKQFEGKDRYEKGYAHIRDMTARMKNEVLKNRDYIAFAGNGNDIERNRREGKISAFLTVEEGGILNGRMERVSELYKMGIRLITLTWNEENCIGYPNSREAEIMEKGLKPFGLDLIREMNEKKMIIDVSHLSDGGFFDVLRTSTKPVAASHSNARSVCAHPRNLSDGMLKALGENGGVAGLNVYPYFLNEQGHPYISDIVRHAVHMINTAGSEAVAVGTDFDGFDGIEEPMELKDVSCMERLYDALHKTGLSEDTLEKIWSKNALRLIGEVL